MSTVALHPLHNVERVAAKRRGEAVTAAALVSGVVFGVGLVISGMTRADKVLGFLDVTGGAWDPSLAFVMVGAIAVHAVILRVIRRRRTQPLLDVRFHTPEKTTVDARLVAGAALFGVGWGLSGVCPGPGLVAVASLAPTLVVFVVGLLVGVALVHIVAP